MTTDPVLAWAHSKLTDMIAFIRELVECESPTDSPSAIERFCDVFSGSVSDLADCEVENNILLCRFRAGRDSRRGQILALGHSDTVWPLGTLANMPFRNDGARLHGPGVLDMKAGLAFFVFAMRALSELDQPVNHRVLLEINPDEEVGSPVSRATTEANAKQSAAVLVLEPGTGLDGKVKTARKGTGEYRVRVDGIAAHSGVDFEKGASAIVELARQIERIAGFTDLARGVTVNPGLISGGTRSNVVAAEAEARVDVRVRTLRDAEDLGWRFHALKPVDPRCSIAVSGGLNRPPMERTELVDALFVKARRLAGDLGVGLEESFTGGGSDGNFTAALGIPTLDGLGAVGEGAHSPCESILVDRIPDRVALLAKLVTSM